MSKPDEPRVDPDDAQELTDASFDRVNFLLEDIKQRIAALPRNDDVAIAAVSIIVAWVIAMLSAALAFGA